MKKHKNIIVLSSLCGLLLLTWGIGVFTSPSAKTARMTSEILLKHFVIKDITDVQIDKNIFSRKDNDWLIGTLPARPDRLDDFFQAMKKTKRLRKVTTSKANLEEYGLQPGKKVVFTMSNGKKQSLLFGKVEYTSKELYALEPDLNKDYVFTLDSSLDFYMRQLPSYWTDLRIFPHPPNEKDIVRIQTTNLKNTFVVVRSLDKDKKAVWIANKKTDNNKEEFDTAKLDDFLRRILRLEGKEVEMFQDIDEKLLVATINLASDKQSYEVRLFKSNDSDIFIAQSSDSSVYQYILTQAVNKTVVREKEYFLLKKEETEVEKNN